MAALAPPSWRFGHLWARWAATGPSVRRELLLVLALLLAYGFFQQVPIWNEYSRYDLVRSLAETGTTTIDRFEGNTGDKAFYAGHFYSDKAPGTALIGVPIYLTLSVAYQVAGAGIPDPPSAVQALAWVESGVFTALLVLLLLRFLRMYLEEPWALFVSIGYGLGSMAFPFATMFFGHAAATFFVFAAFYALWRARAYPDDRSLPTLAGLALGVAILVDVSTALGAIVLGAYALAGTRDSGPWIPRKAARVGGLMVAGAIVPAALFMAYNWVSFGGPFSLGYQYLANAGFARGVGRGIFGVTVPDARVLADLLFSPRGLITLAPWLLVAPFGLISVIRRAVQRELIVAGVITSAFLLANAGYYLPFGGATPGPRFLLPALPFAAILVAFAPKVFRPVTIVLVLVSVAIFMATTITMPNAAEGYADPLRELWIPRAISGEIAQTIAWLRFGLAGAAPVALLAGVLVATFALTGASFRWPALADQPVLAAAVGLLVLIGLFAFPFWPARAFGIGQVSAGPQFSILQTGSTPARSDGGTRLGIWAQIENRGAAVADTKVTFTVSSPDGKPTWAAWLPTVDWAAGERKRIGVQWDTSKVAPAVYPIEIRVERNSDHATLASVRSQTKVDPPADTGLQGLPQTTPWALLLIFGNLVGWVAWKWSVVDERVRRWYGALNERWPLRQLVPDAGTALLIVLAISLLLRAAWLNLPQGGLIFDEAYYVNASRVLVGIHPPAGAHYADSPLYLDPNTEHPPLGKALIAASILFFGDNGVGWRAPSVIAAMLALVAVYGIVRALRGRPWLAVLATALYSIDILSFIHGRIGTLDMMSLAFLLLGAWLALRQDWVFAGAALALGTLVKVPGVYGFAAVFAWLALAMWRTARKRRLVGEDFIPMAALVGAYAFVGFAGLWLLDLRFTTFSTPLDHINRMLSYGFALQGGFSPSGITSAPWQWLINDGQFDYFKTAVNTVVNGTVTGSRATIQFRALLNPVLIGAASIGALYGAWLAFRRGEPIASFGLLWIAANYLPYFPLVLFSHRISYFYYVLPAVPGLALVMAAFLVHARLPRGVVIGFVIAAAIAFAAYFPFREIPG